MGNGSLIPIPEILSYDSFIQESSKYSKYDYNNIPLIYGVTGNGSDQEFRWNFFINRNEQIRRFDDNFLLFENSFNPRRNNNFKSANKEFDDTWLHIYINGKHFEKNKTAILSCFGVLKFGDSGLKKFDFHPQYIFEIMPNDLCEMIIKMTKEKIFLSFIKCFSKYSCV